MARTISTSFRLPNHVLGRLRHLSTDVGCTQAELVQELVNVAISHSEMREILKARHQARGLLDGIVEQYGPDPEVVFHDHGGGEVTLVIDGEEPRDLKGVVVPVDLPSADLRILTIYHRELGLRIQPRLPAATYQDEAGLDYRMSLSDLYPD